MRCYITIWRSINTYNIKWNSFLNIGESNRIRTVPTYGYLGISETINPTKKCLINIHNYINSLYFYFLITQNIADISNKLNFLLCF